MLIFRSSRSQMFFKIGVLKNFAIFTRKHLWWLLKVFFYRTPTVTTLDFCGSKYFFSAESSIYCWQLLQVLLRTWKHALNLRSSHCHSSVKKGILRNFANLTGKKLSVLKSVFHRVASLKACSHIKRHSNIDVFL